MRFHVIITLYKGVFLRSLFNLNRLPFVCLTLVNKHFKVFRQQQQQN